MDGTLLAVGLVAIFLVAVIKHVSKHFPDEPEPPPEKTSRLFDTED